MISQEIKEKITRLKPRTVFKQIEQFLDLPDIEILLGMRQVGKTSLLYLIIDHLVKKGVPESNIFFFSLNDMSILSAFNKNQKELENFIEKQKIDINHRVYIFIDEIQYMENPAMFLKYYVDKFSNFKLFVTGSSSLEIKNKIKESLAGRKKIINISPLSFKEFLEFKNENSNSIKTIEKIINLEHFNTDVMTKNALQNKFFEYILYGGHPKISQMQTENIKIAELNDIYSSYIQKDIKDFANIENVPAYNSLIQIIASQVGNLINYSKVSSTIDLDLITLKKYILILQNTFVAYLLKPYSKNKQKEISKMPKVFLEDLGIRNIISSDFRPLDLRENKGALVENFVFNELRKSQGLQEELFFWRTLNKNEVDFVYKKAGKIIPIEVKYQNFKSTSIPSGIKGFISRYKPKKAIVLTKDYFDKINFKNTEIIFFPVYLI